MQYIAICKQGYRKIKEFLSDNSPVLGLVLDVDQLFLKTIQSLHSLNPQSSQKCSNFHALLCPSMWWNVHYWFVQDSRNVFTCFYHWVPLVPSLSLWGVVNRITCNQVTGSTLVTHTPGSPIPHNTHPAIQSYRAYIVSEQVCENSKICENISKIFRKKTSWENNWWYLCLISGCVFVSFNNSVFVWYL